MKNRFMNCLLEIIFGNPIIFKFFQEFLLPKPYTLFKKDLVRKYVLFDEKVIDFACSIGHMSEVFPKNNNYIGIDISERYLKNAQKLYPHRKFILVKKDEELPFKDNTIGSILCFSVFHHISDTELENMLILFKKLLKRGGKIIITDQLPWRDQKTLLNKLMVRCDIGNYCRSPEAFRNLFKEHFNLVETKICQIGNYMCQYHILTKEH